MIKKGFTLIELLVVISVIGILATIVLVSFTGIQKQARDTARKSDLKQYQSAMEAAASKNTSGLYPSRTTAQNPTTNLCTDLGLTNCPTDPKSPDYFYYVQTDGVGGGGLTATKYVFWATLENQPTGTYWVVCSNGKVGQTSAGIPTTGGACPL